MQPNQKLHKVGALIKVNNREHVWHNRLGVVREINRVNGFHRVDIAGTLIWFPSHWITAREP